MPHHWQAPPLKVLFSPPTEKIDLATLLPVGDPKAQVLSLLALLVLQVLSLLAFLVLQVLKLLALLVQVLWVLSLQRQYAYWRCCCCSVQIARDMRGL